MGKKPINTGFPYYFEAEPKKVLRFHHVRVRSGRRSLKPDPSAPLVPPIPNRAPQSGRIGALQAVHPPRNSCGTLSSTRSRDLTIQTGPYGALEKVLNDGILLKVTASCGDHESDIFDQTTTTTRTQSCGLTPFQIDLLL